MDATGAAAPTTVVELLDRRRHDERVGLRFGDKSWSWQEVVGAGDAYAAALMELQRPGPFHVGLLLDNLPEYLFALFGCASAGAVAVGVNNTRRGDELARDIRHTDCQLVITSAAQRGLLEGFDLGAAAVHVVDSPQWRERLAAATARPRQRDSARPAPGDDFTFMFTSGSTGAPKAVRMSHRRAARAAAAATWFTADDVLYCAMPLFHGNALNAIVLPALSTGATIALRERFSASQFMPDVRRFGATFFSTVGRALAYILATPPDPADREHKVKFALAPESSPADVSAFRKRFGIHCVTGYGSSENAIVMVPVPGMPKDALGVPQEGIDAAIIDPATGAECPRARFDEQGRLLNADEAIGEIVGRNVASRFEGYYNNPEAEAERLRDGWYWSGDLGYRDPDNVFYFAGRSGEWLRVDSENFAVAPVERILARFPGAAGVAVFGVPDERTADDQVMAVIEMAGGAAFEPEAFESFLARQADLGTKWAPRYVRIAAKLPVGATNKIDKRSLKAERWYTADPIYWRPDRSGSYRRFTPDDLAELEKRFAAFGRSIDRPG